MMASKWEKLPAKRRKNKLSYQQERVIDHYFGAANFQKAKALRMAGYSTPQGYLRFFQNPDVVAEVERRWAEVRERYDVTYDKVVGELAKVAFSNITDYVEVDENGDMLVALGHASAHELAAIGEVQVESYVDHWEEDEDGNRFPVKVKRVRVKPWNKLHALDQLMRHAGLSKDKTSDALVDIASRISSGARRIAMEDEG